LFQVVREHDPLGRDVELFRKHLYTSGKVGPTSKGSEGAELVDGLVIREGDFKLVKTRFSAFFSTHLESVLQRAGINCLVVTGEYNSSNAKYELTILCLYMLELSI
jgi:nicotinamidase-related amidase